MARGADTGDERIGAPLMGVTLLVALAARSSVQRLDHHVLETRELGDEPGDVGAPVT
ncbi:MAG: hypothetical protein H0V04_06700 [Chloroflexi bacterium]|nr:hypothetical protein [Chloroflexota bacterium]